MSKYKIAVLGGDKRQAILASLLSEAGFECAAFATPASNLGGATNAIDAEGALTGAAAVLLPLPVTRDGKTLNAPAYDGSICLSALEEQIPKEAPILGGMIKAEHFPSHRCHDYYEGEELKLLNTIPTAEGAVAIAMNELPTTLRGTKTLVLGFGRVGKTLGMMLKGLGAVLSVATRNRTEAAICEIMGIETTDYATLPKAIGDYGLIFNTVPSVLLRDSLLESVSDSAPVIDLATYPGGVDFEKAEALGKRVIWALALPGKVAPVTAATYIKKAVLRILEEEGIAL